MNINRQADLLQNKYVDKTRRLDRLFCETQPDQVGRIEAKLFSCEEVPERERVWLERSMAGERAMVVGHLQRKLSVAAVNASVSAYMPG